jgi:hypothetical protein
VVRRAAPCKLEEKRAKLDALYRDPSNDDLFTRNRQALRKLTWLYLNLLVAQRKHRRRAAVRRGELRSNRAYEGELSRAVAAARASHEATLRLLRERLDNLQHKEITLAEIDADLARIETQFDVALEEATLRGRPTAISANVELMLRLLGNIEDLSLEEVAKSQSLKVSE